MCVDCFGAEMQAESNDDDGSLTEPPVSGPSTTRVAADRSRPTAAVALSLPIQPPAITARTVPVVTEIEIPVEVLLVAAADDDEDDDFDDKDGGRPGSNNRGFASNDSGVNSSHQRRRCRRSRTRPATVAAEADGQFAAAASSSHHPTTILLSPLNELEESTSSSSSSSSGCCSEDDDDDEWEDVEEAGDNRSRSDGRLQSTGSESNDAMDNMAACGERCDDETGEDGTRRLLMSTDEVDQFFDVESSSPMNCDRTLSTSGDESPSSAAGYHVTRVGMQGSNATTALTTASMSPMPAANGGAVLSDCMTQSSSSRTASRLSREQHQQQGTTGLTTRLGNLFNSAVMKAHRQLGRGE